MKFISSLEGRACCTKLSSLLDGKGVVCSGSCVVVASACVVDCVVGSLLFSSGTFVGCGMKPKFGGNPKGYGGSSIVATGAAA